MLDQRRGLSLRLPVSVKVALLVGVVALASIGYFSSFRQKDDSTKTGIEEPDQNEIAARKPVVDFNLLDANGDSEAFSKLRGEVVILTFWASWCPPCLVELPTFAELAKKFSGRGLRVVPVNVDDGETGKNFAREFWKTKDFDFKSFFDPSKEVASKFGVDMLPATFVIDRHGRIAMSALGANDWTNDQTVDVIDALLDERQ